MIKFLDILREIGNIKDPNVPGKTLSYGENNIGKGYEFTINDKKISLSIVNNIAYALELLDKIYGTNYNDQLQDDKQPNKQSANLKQYYEENEDDDIHHLTIISDFFQKSKIFPKTSAILSFLSNNSFKSEQDKKKYEGWDNEYKKWQKMWDDIRKEGFKTPEEAWEKYVNNVNGESSLSDGSPRAMFKNNPSENMKRILNTNYILIDPRFKSLKSNISYQEWLQNIKDKPLPKQPKFKDQTKEYLEILSKLSGIIKNYIDKEKPDVVIVNYKLDGIGVSEETTNKRNKLYKYYLEKYKPSNYSVKTKDYILYLEKDGK